MEKKKCLWKFDHLQWLKQVWKGYEKVQEDEKTCEDRDLPEMSVMKISVQNPSSVQYVPTTGNLFSLYVYSNVCYSAVLLSVLSQGQI